MNINKIYFYNKESQYPSSGLTFYKNMKDNEIIYHIYSDKISHHKRLDWSDCHNQLNLCILKWNKQLIRKIRNAYKLFVDSCDKYIFKIIMYMNLDIYFVCSSDDLEFGYPHTNSNYVFLPKSKIENTNKIIDIAKIIFHELIHIYQRFTPNKKFIDTYCKSLGYIYINNIKNNIFKSHIAISNPDTQEHGTYFYIENHKIYYFLLHYNTLKLKLERKTYMFSKNKWVEVDFIPDIYPRITQYEHPFEVMACHWVIEYFY